MFVRWYLIDVFIKFFVVINDCSWLMLFCLLLVCYLLLWMKIIKGCGLLDDFCCCSIRLRCCWGLLVLVYVILCWIWIVLFVCVFFFWLIYELLVIVIVVGIKVRNSMILKFIFVNCVEINVISLRILSCCFVFEYMLYGEVV